MSVQIDQVSAFQKRLQFTVPGAEVQKRLDDAFRNLAARVQLPGFRRGKVPRKVLEARWGKQLRSEVAADIINWEFRQASQDLEFIGQPEVQKDDLREGGDFSFSVTVQVRPEVEVSGYKGIKVDFPATSVPDAVVEAQVQRRLQAAARVEEVTEDRPVQVGDLVLTEITKVDGTVIESGTMVNTAGERYYPGAETLLVGKKVGESARGTVQVRGEPAEVDVKVLGIQVSRTPELTDAVATELGYEGGAEALRAAVRMEEESRANDAARNVARVNLLNALVAANPVDVPPAMVDSHFQLLMEELRIQNAYRGRDPRSVRYSDAQLADLRNRAAFAARSSLLLDAVARAEGIQVTDDDLERKYQEIADMRGQRVEAIRGYFVKDNAVEELRKRLLEERTLDWLLEVAEVNYVSPEAEAAPAAAEAATVAVEAPPAEAPAEAVEKPKKKRKSKKAEETEAAE